MSAGARLRHGLVVVAGALLLAGCAATSVFIPYPSQAEAFRQAASVNAPDVLTKLNARRDSADGMLYLMERARLLQLQGDYAGSKDDFAQVIADFDKNDDKATISLSDTGAAGTSLLTNDNAIPYKGYGYERVMAHQFQAYNYLGLHDIEGATVELRNAQQVQRNLELKYESQVAKDQGDAAQNNIPLGEYDSYFAGMDTITGPLKNSFQNGYSFYLAATIWEAIGEINDALVDYKKALELSPSNTAIQQDVIRVGRRMDGKYPPKGAAPSGTVVVMFEQGFVPAKQPVNLSIPLLDGTFLNIAFPVYDAHNYTPPSPLTIRGDASVQTTILVDTSALAVKALREQVPGMLVRQVLRASAKHELQQRMAKQGGLVGQLAANIYSIVSEQADLRSWLTLPANTQATRIDLPPGPRSLELASTSGSLSVPVEVRTGRTTIVRVVEVYGRLLTQTYAL